MIRFGRGSEYVLSKDQHWKKVEEASRKKWCRNKKFSQNCYKLIAQTTKKVEQIAFSLKCNPIIVLFTTFFSSFEKKRKKKRMPL